MENRKIWKSLLALLILAPNVVYPHFKTTPDSPIHINDNKGLEYKISPNGDRVPDYSYCGFMASEQAIPNIPVKVVVPHIQGDATAEIQRAIDYVSSLPLNENGFRGTVLLEEGVFEVAGSLQISTSGVVLRGSGCAGGGTILKATGFDRETLIRITGKNDCEVGDTVALADVYVPVNATQLSFTGGHPFKVGDHVIVNRPSTKEWLEFIGTDKIGIYVDYTLTKWNPGDFDINWDRKVVAVGQNSITLDVPLTNSLDPQFGGGNVLKYTWAGRISNVGVENLKCVSSYDDSNIKDENHRWMAITMDNVTDAWVRRVVAENFVSSAVAIWETASRVTVEDCKSLSPIGEIGGFRRYAFQTLGQQVLFQRCYSEFAWHAFSVGFTTPGPNAFVQCYSYRPYNFSGSTGGWSTGILFDNMTIDGGNIGLGWRDVDGQGGGWSAANSLCWSSRVAQIHLAAPPTAQNWAYASWAQGYGNGHHELQHTFVQPKSIYYAQLEARTHAKSIETDKILVYDSNETTAPSPEMTAIVSERSKEPDLIMDAWIDSMMALYPLVADLSGAKKLSEIKQKIQQKEIEHAPSLALKNGWLVAGDKVITGQQARTAMWRGSTRPDDIKNGKPNLVRFVPGREGNGLTDNLDTLTNGLLKENIFGMQYYPALWYERRRDDHARYRRVDADVWTPFYEQPFSRSGQGEAWDRLSKYDLTKWNTWYWLRLKKYADLADQKGLLLIKEHYLQHNIIEEGAHWADYPWRTANNINNVGFPENPHYAGDKRVYMAVQFYDTTNVVRKELHRNYIRKCLDEFKDNTNVIHHLGKEFSGPKHFVDFWLDVIAEWEKENNKDVLVMLPGTKDVQDTILNDPKRSKMVDIIDVIQWQYRKDGSLYAPIGGVSITQRQYARIMDVGETSFDQIYRAVSEFKKAYPEKAMVYSRMMQPGWSWAVFMAGGSFSALPVISDEAFLVDAATMECLPQQDGKPGQYVLGNMGKGYIVYSQVPEFSFDLKADNNTYKLSWVNPATGEIVPSKIKVGKGNTGTIKAPFEGAAVAWLHK